MVRCSKMSVHAGRRSMAPDPIVCKVAWLCHRLWKIVPLKREPTLRTPDMGALGRSWSMSSHDTSRQLGWQSRVGFED